MSIRYITVAMLLAVALSLGGGVELIEQQWEDEIAQDNYEIGTGDPSHTSPTDPTAPEGIY